MIPVAIIVLENTKTVRYPTRSPTARQMKAPGTLNAMCTATMPVIQTAAIPNSSTRYIRRNGPSNPTLNALSNRNIIRFRKPACRHGATSVASDHGLSSCSGIGRSATKEWIRMSISPITNAIPNTIR